MPLFNRKWKQFKKLFAKLNIHVNLNEYRIVQYYFIEPRRNSAFTEIHYINLHTIVTKKLKNIKNVQKNIL